MNGDTEREITLSEGDLQFINQLVDEAVSSDDTAVQDRALELQEKLPDSSSRRWL